MSQQQLEAIQNLHRAFQTMTLSVKSMSLSFRAANKTVEEVLVAFQPKRPRTVYDRILDDNLF